LAAFYIDDDVALEVARLLHVSGHAAVTARDIGREGDRDDEQLLVASQQDHIFLTHNEADFVLLHDAWQRWSNAWGVSARHSAAF
jgi:predicted nuclease of predicted toxin-antitoxin system